jgi:hypothetical protein
VPDAPKAAFPMTEAGKFKETQRTATVR